MLRLFGGGLILCGAGMLRRAYLVREKEKIRRLLSLANALCTLEQRLTLTLQPIPKLLLAGRDEFFSCVSALLSDGQTLGEAWASAALMQPLPDAAAEDFAALGTLLDAEEESARAAILRASEMLRREAERADAALAEKRRPLSALCFGGGFLLCVLLL